jgi:hypothetical protein
MKVRLPLEQAAFSPGATCRDFGIRYVKAYYSAQQESFAGSFRREIATILSASDIVG